MFVGGGISRRGFAGLDVNQRETTGRQRMLNCIKQLVKIVGVVRRQKHQDVEEFTALQPLFPMIRRVQANISQMVGAACHAFLELGGEFGKV
jgi:hypothetical protein